MDIHQLKSRMQKALSVVKDDIATIRVGRATPSLVESIMVPAYGGTQPMRVMELGTIHADDSQSLTIRPWDQSVIGEIAKAINTANLGINAVIDSEVIRIKIPPLTEERRREYVKLLGSKIENGKVAVRQIRHDVIEDVRKQEAAKDISEDDKFRFEKEIQKVTDESIKELDAMEKQKEEELMRV